MSDCPRQADGIEINKVDDGYVVYQPARDRIHYLNHTAAIVLELCNGETPTDSIADLLKDAYDLPNTPADEIQQCLDKLYEEELIR